MMAGTVQADMTCDLFMAPAEPEGDMPMMMSAEILKSDPGRRMVFGFANVSMTADGGQVVDAHRDMIDPDDLESAAYEHVLNFRATGEMHQGEAIGRLVESFFINPAKLAAMGLAEDALPTAWWVGYRVDDPDVFAKVLDGTYRAFSIQGRAERVPVEEE
jgi:hypothetical protein